MPISLHITVCDIQQQSFVVTTETVWSTKPKIFNIWPFTEKNHKFHSRFNYQFCRTKENTELSMGNVINKISNEDSKPALSNVTTIILPTTYF